MGKDVYFYSITSVMDNKFTIVVIKLNIS